MAVGKKTSCPKGKILRVGYTTKRGTTVRPTCIKDKGKPGKGAKVWQVRRGGLKPYKVVNPKTKEIMSPTARRRRLRKAYESVQKEEGYTKKGLLIVRMNAIRNYFKNSKTERGKKIHAAIGSDIRWAQKKL